MRLLEIRHLDGKELTLCGLHVVREDHGGSVRSWPEPAELRLALASHEQQAVGVEAQQLRDAPLERPERKVREPFVPDEHPSASDLKRPRDESLHTIEGI